MNILRHSVIGALCACLGCGASDKPASDPGAGGTSATTGEGGADSDSQKGGSSSTGSGGAAGTGNNTGGSSVKGGAGGSSGRDGGGASSAGGQSSVRLDGGQEGGAIARALPTPPTSDVPKPSGTPGEITVLDWAGFKAAVTYTFDDANSSQIQHYAELNALNVPFTFYLQTGKSDAADDVWRQAVLDGHELGNHTVHHWKSGQGDLGADTDTASTFIYDKFGVTAWTMAAPYGDSAYVDVAKTRFLINRGVSDGLIAPNGATDPFNANCYIPAETATATAFNNKVDAARSAGKWQVMLVHGFAGGSDQAYQPVALNEFIAGIEHAKSLGDVWIDTMVNVGAYWLAQKAFSQATPTTSGVDKTWTWTLPDHFPPGRYLRVTVEGGTLKQGDETLTWNSHGYYEIALDKGSVTLSP